MTNKRSKSYAYLNKPLKTTRFNQDMQLIKDNPSDSGIVTTDRMNRINEDEDIKTPKAKSGQVAETEIKNKGDMKKVMLANESVKDSI